MSIKSRSKKRRWITFSIVIIVIIGIAGAIFLRPVKTDYSSIEAKTGDIATYYSFSGNIETTNRQTVMAEKVMQISTINVKEGDLVKEGDVLVKSSAGDEIKAKIGGEIVNLKVEENAQVMSGAKLMEIVDYDQLQISVKVDEYDLKAVTAGKETKVSIGALDKEIKGTIRSIANEGLTQNGVTFFVAVIDLEKDASLKVGMSAEVTLLNEKASGVVLLPMKVILFDNDNSPYVLKKNEKGLPVQANITTGINDGTSVEIKSGVTSGESILDTSSASATTVGLFGNRGNTKNTGGTN